MEDAYQRYLRLWKEVLKDADALHIPYSKHIYYEVSNKLTSSFGKCIFKEKKYYIIRLSTRIFMSPYDDQIKNTMMHELIHTCPNCMNHGDMWKAYAFKVNSQLGYHVTTTSKNEAFGLKTQEKVKPYAIQCTKCGAIVERTRLSKVIEHPEYYKCKCGGKLKRIR